MVSPLVTLEKEKGSGKSRCVRRQEPSFSDSGINCWRRDKSPMTKQGKNTLKTFIYPELHWFSPLPQVVLLKKKKVYDFRL